MSYPSLSTSSSNSGFGPVLPVGFTSFRSYTLTMAFEDVATRLQLDDFLSQRWVTYQTEQMQRQYHSASLSMLEINRRFYHGDHWQYSNGWVGPLPQPGDPGYARIMCEIRRAFTSANTIKEIVDRHTSGVLGKEPMWDIQLTRPLKPDEEPTEAEKSLIEELEAILTTWWDRRQVLKHLKEAMRRALYASAGPLRMYIPSGRIDGDSIPTIPVEDSLMQYVWLEFAEPERAAIVCNADTKEEAGVFTWMHGGIRMAEISFIDGDPSKYSEDNPTVIRILSAGAQHGAGEAEVLSEISIKLRGQVLVFDMCREPLITEPVRQQQMLQNLALTMLSRNVVAGGFLERIILNGQPAGKWTKQDGIDKWVADPVQFGSGVTTWVQGESVEQEDGKIVKSTPNVIYRDPVPVDTFERTSEIARIHMLKEARQIHVEMNKDANASGVSRLEAREDYLGSLYESKPFVDAAIRWVLLTAIAFAEVLSGKPGRYAGLEPYSDIKPDAGPLDPEERKAIIEQWDRELISRERAMMILGVDDVEAEIQRIRQELKTKSVQFVDVKGLWTPTSKLEAEIDERLGLTPRTDADVAAQALQETQVAADRAKALAEAVPPQPAPTGAVPSKNQPPAENAS